MTDLTQVTATKLSELYQSGTASPVTVAKQVLAKIERVNPTINAFCFVDPDTTLSQAQASEQRWRQGRPLSALDGVPVAIKDSILTQGWPTLHGSRATDPDQNWSEDAPVSARLKESGAVLVGKTTTTEFGSGDCSITKSDLYGVTRNPQNIKYTTGGSSGGSAAAVSANIVPLSIGSDLAGSITVPSAFCGVFGLKPSFGRVPKYPGDAFNFSAVGPMARSVSDIALVMNTITQPDYRDCSSLPYDNVDYVKQINSSIHGIKVAYCPSVNSISVDPEILTKTYAVVHWLRSHGATTELVNFDVDISNAQKIFKQTSNPEILHHWNNIPAHLQNLTSRDIQKWALLSHFDTDIYHLVNQRRQITVSMRKFMQDYDVIVTPATIMAPDKITVDDTASIDSGMIISPWSIVSCITQQPTITVPTGLNSNSMPVAVQIIGPMHNDVRVLQVAQALSSAFPMTKM
jgi:aspartyl-tRNA(Asn)/glutamyl-tRNA(Gln) amidotransferase subunit A